MSAFTAELDRELLSMEPEAAAHFERAVREMLLLARTQRGGGKKTAPDATTVDSLPAFPMGGFLPGIDRHKLGQLPADF